MEALEKLPEEKPVAGVKSTLKRLVGKDPPSIGHFEACHP